MSFGRKEEKTVSFCQIKYVPDIFCKCEYLFSKDGILQQKH